MEKLKIKSLISCADLTLKEYQIIFKLTEELKKKQKKGIRHHILSGKTLGMIFEKSSTRTRVSFEVGMYQLGGHALYLSSNDLQLGRGETIADTAKVMSRYVDGIMARTYAHKTVEDLALFGSVPVINGLSDQEHPCQVICDYFTVKEKLGKLKGVKFAYLGDGNNMAHSLYLAGAILGIDLSFAHPEGYMPDKDVIIRAKEFAKKSGSKIEIYLDPVKAVKDADVVYTDVWTSMGQEKEKIKRLKDFKHYQINAELMKNAKKKALVMHCLPAHRGEEITDEVIDGPNSIVFDEAENRLHTQKAVMALLMSK
jgi:ornithine carbamoyltransferase